MTTAVGISKSAPGRLRLKIVLDHLKPAIWRRVEVNDNLTFWQLHRVIQQAMGWEDCHLHEFEVDRQCIGTASNDDFMQFIADVQIPERRTTLAAMLDGKRKFRYWYDFGDDWWHTIAIEKRLPPAPDAPPAVLIDGENACPPEDCGGIHGYVNLLEILDDPRREEHEDIRDWLGDDFDPDFFDCAAHARKVANVVRKRKERKEAKTSAAE